MTESPIAPSGSPDEFEKQRYEYCKRVYEREDARREALERKAQLYLSLVTLFLGAVLLKVDTLAVVRDVISSPDTGPAFRIVLIVLIVIFSASLMICLFGILMSMHVRGYSIEHPVNTVSALFEPGSEYLESETESAFFRATGRSYALALESDRTVNDKKATWVAISSYALFAAIGGLTLFLGILVFIGLI